MSNTEIDPSTFEIGDEIKASHNEIDGWREIVRLFSAYLIVNGEEDYIVMHDFITAHRKPKIKPEKVFAIKPDNDPVKPPLGLKPRSIVADHRVMDICSAIARYGQADMKIPECWTDELLDILANKAAT